MPKKVGPDLGFRNAAKHNPQTNEAYIQAAIDKQRADHQHAMRGLSDRDERVSCHPYRTRTFFEVLANSSDPFSDVVSYVEVLTPSNERQVCPSGSPGSRLDNIRDSALECSARERATRPNGNFRYFRDENIASTCSGGIEDDCYPLKTVLYVAREFRHSQQAQRSFDCLNTAGSKLTLILALTLGSAAVLACCAAAFSKKGRKKIKKTRKAFKAVRKQFKPKKAKPALTFSPAVSAPATVPTVPVPAQPLAQPVVPTAPSAGAGTGLPTSTPMAKPAVSTTLTGDDKQAFDSIWANRATVTNDPSTYISSQPQAI